MEQDKNLPPCSNQPYLNELADLHADGSITLSQK